jgi:hypothetical protein
MRNDCAPLRRWSENKGTMVVFLYVHGAYQLRLLVMTMLSKNGVGLTISFIEKRMFCVLVPL